jgi:rod shape-determining protein MreD
MRSVTLVLFGFSLLVVQGALATLVPMHAFAPNLMLPIAIFLGISGEVHIVRGAVLCFVLGYLLDSFCGNPMGLWTFVLVAAYFMARGAGLRLVPQGPTFQVLLTFAMSLVSGGAILALRGIFENREFLSLDVGGSAVHIAQSGVVTAVLAPLIFGVCRRIETWSTQRGDPRGAPV